jgi:hypothetical protein
MNAQLKRDLELIGRWCSATGARYSLSNGYGTWFVAMVPGVGQNPCGYGDICQAVHETATAVAEQVLRLEEAVPSIIGDWEDEG